MKFENLAPDTQNALLNGGKLIVHSVNYNVHISTAETVERLRYPEHLLQCHSCEGYVAEGDFDVIQVEFPEEFPGELNLSEALVRIMAAKTLVKRLYLDAVRAGESGMDALTILFALENGRSDGYTNEDDRAWSEFVISQRNRALIAVTNEKSAAFRAQQQQGEKL